jgi:hypothetical protein
MFLQFNICVQSIGVALGLLMSTHALAAGFSSPNHLVVLRLGNGNAVNFGTAQPLFLDEYDVGGPTATFVQTVPLPSSGSFAVTLPDSNSHDGLLNRSVDGQYLVFAGYRADAFTSDPSLNLASTTPRVIARVSASGTVDTSTALTDSYHKTVVRAVVSDDGSRFWVAGDNADAHPLYSTFGGLRYVAALGANSTTNLSQVQDFSPPPTPDNVRSIGIFAGQLYESSGSDSSIGKSVFEVGIGLPTTGSQTLKRLTTDGASTNAFFLADLNEAVPGVDTLYSSTSAQGIGLHKYSKLCAGDNCNWVANGIVALPGIEAITAAVSGSDVIIYATDGGRVLRLTDSTGYNAAIVGVFNPILSAAENQSFRGMAFAPTSAGLPGDYNRNGTVDAADYVVWRKMFGAMDTGLAADGNGDHRVDDADYAIWKSHFGQPPGSAAGAAIPAASIPEPESVAVLVVASLCVAVRRERKKAATVNEANSCVNPFPKSVEYTRDLPSGSTLPHFVGRSEL